MTDFATILSSTTPPVRNAAYWRAAHEMRRRQVHRSDPVSYFRERLGRTMTPGQMEMAASVRDNPRTMVIGAHSTGKSYAAAGLVWWRYDNFRPSVTITTAPSRASVKDILWKDIRTLRHGHPDLMPRDTRLDASHGKPGDSPDHIALGMTADSGEGFQGRKSDRLLLIFDECVGIDPVYWEAADGMMTSDGCRMLAMCNPTDPGTEAYRQIQAKGADGKPRWNLITLSALDHPNVIAELAGKPRPIPGAAVTLGWVNDKVAAWCKPVDAGQRSPVAIEWPPGSGLWHEPDARFEARVIPRWPSKAAYAVWDLSVFNAACTRVPVWPNNVVLKPIIGVDPARFGDDLTAIVIRRGPNVVHAETFGKQSTAVTVARLKSLAAEWAGKHGGMSPKQVLILVDEEGLGAGVLDHAGGFNFVGVRSSLTAAAEDDYPNVRSELWFNTAERAVAGGMSLAMLAEPWQAELRKQAMAPQWRLDARGRRACEPKADTKRRLGCSPDLLDALNLAFYEGASVGMVGAAGQRPGIHW